MHRRHLLALCALASACTAFSPLARADAISPEMQKVVDGYRAKLLQWAANPVVVSAAKASNASGGIPGVTPAKWTELADTDPAVKSLVSSPAGKFVDSLDSKEVNKVVVRDKTGNVVAANTKVVLYNVAHRPVFKTAITGTPWQQDQMQKDVTTQLMGVQIAVPIKDGAEVVGVMHAAISAK
jgi:hypothetical protein